MRVCVSQHVAPVESEANFMAKPFDWLHQWYPVAVVTDLDPSRRVRGDAEIDAAQTERGCMH